MAVDWRLQDKTQLKWKTDLDKVVIVANFERRNWPKVGGEGPASPLDVELPGRHWWRRACVCTAALPLTLRILQNAASRT
jgi:hypothetical protein